MNSAPNPIQIAHGDFHGKTSNLDAIMSMILRHPI
jgi:hypothetical protein